jgi:hypothetical protein
MWPVTWRPFRVLCTPQKSRLLQTATKLLSEKAPQATFSDGQFQLDEGGRCQDTAR